MEFTGPYRFRLTIGIPLVVICFTLAAGFLPLGMIDNSIAHLDRIFDLRELVFRLKIAVLVLAAVATAISIMMSKYIVRPIEKLVNEMEEMGIKTKPETEAGGPQENRTDDEIDRLSKLYKETFVPMKGYLTTADLFLQMSEGIVSLDADGKVAFLNAPMERLFGIHREKYIGKHFADLFPNPARNTEVHEMIDDVIHRKMARTRDTLIWTPSGRDVYLRVTVSPATGKHNESIGAVMLFEDIEEFSKLRDQLRRMDVLATIGGTITGMAHEVKTPLGYIRGLAELIKEDLPKEAPQQKYVGSIIESIDRLNGMVEEILSLASVKIDNSQAHDPKIIVREAISYVRDKLTANNLRLIEDYPQATSPIKADRQKLVEAFINILRNGCEAAPAGAALNIRIRPVILGHAPDLDQDTLMFEFHNEGSFIDPQTKEKLFTPFFTTKKQGTGLGLAISKQIVEAHGGAIQVESDEHSGTLFRVMLPATLRASSAVAAESPAK
jgi:two-component system, sporulation sensor kinase E